MSTQHFGYVRVSSADQSTARQLSGITLDRIFTDYANGKDRNRPPLDALLKHARPGDTIHVHSIDRFARSVADLGLLVSSLTERGIWVNSTKKG